MGETPGAVALGPMAMTLSAMGNPPPPVEVLRASDTEFCATSPPPSLGPGEGDTRENSPPGGAEARENGEARGVPSMAAAAARGSAPPELSCVRFDPGWVALPPEGENIAPGTAAAAAATATRFKGVSQPDGGPPDPILKGGDKGRDATAEAVAVEPFPPPRLALPMPVAPPALPKASPSALSSTLLNSPPPALSRASFSII